MTIEEESDEGHGNRSPLAFALICGGRSERMRELGDKALLPWPPPQGPSLFEVQLAKLASMEDNESLVFLSCRTEQAHRFVDSGARIILDSTEDSGPLAGLASCLREAHDEGKEALLVIAVDLPLLRPSLLGQLLESRTPLAGRGVVARSSGRWQPLVGIYPTGLVDEAERRLDAGELRLTDFVDWALANDHIEPLDFGNEDAAAFQNLNTPADYSVAAAQLGSAGLKIERHSKAPEWERREIHDEVAAEEPLEIRVEGKSVAVVMRTPGHDEELAAGFLLTEGIATKREDFFEISQCPSVEDEQARGNVIDVLLGGDAKSRDLDQLTRHVFTSSSCGICGKATIDSVFQCFAPVTSGAQLDRDLLLDLPHRLRHAQRNFRRTGGLHASALFDVDSGELLLLREDVGRHNALDKVIGHAVLNAMTPLANAVLLLSGRISFELMQKALAAGIPIVAGISAPSSLAVNFARESGQTLVGFLRDETFNVYAGKDRLK